MRTIPLIALSIFISSGAFAYDCMNAVIKASVAEALKSVTVYHCADQPIHVQELPSQITLTLVCSADTGTRDLTYRTDLNDPEICLLSTPYIVNEEPRNYYSCQYDGGQDAYTWQLAGQDIPQPGAAKCLEAEGPQYCLNVVDGHGNTLGMGRWCGDENGHSPFLNVKAYAQ